MPTTGAQNGSSGDEPSYRVAAEYGEGSVTLAREGWFAVMAALEGDESQRDDAFDALQRRAPRPWLEVLDEQEERRRSECGR